MGRAKSEHSNTLNVGSQIYIISNLRYGGHQKWPNDIWLVFYFDKIGLHLMTKICHVSVIFLRLLHSQVDFTQGNNPPKNAQDFKLKSVFPKLSINDIINNIFMRGGGGIYICQITEMSEYCFGLQTFVYYISWNKDHEKTTWLHK